MTVSHDSPIADLGLTTAAPMWAPIPAAIALAAFLASQRRPHRR